MEARSALLDECLPALIHLYTAPTLAMVAVGGDRCDGGAESAKQEGAAADAGRCLINLAGDSSLGLCLISNYDGPFLDHCLCWTIS